MILTGETEVLGEIPLPVLLRASQATDALVWS